MYYGDWSIYEGQKNFYPSMMEPKYITHLNFAFLDMDSNGDLVILDEHADFLATSFPELSGLTYGAPYAGVLGALFILKLKYRHLKVGISVGGWGRSYNFPIVSADKTKRENFATNIVKFIEYLGYDFVDIDWEYPSTAADTENFTLFLKAIRDKLDALGQKHGKHYELSIAMSANPTNMAIIQYDKVLQIVDFTNMMTYDLAGGWSSYTAHHTALYTNEAYNHQTMGDAIFSANYCIQYFEKTYGSSIDMSKVLIGVAPYTHGWGNVQNNGLDPNNPGLFATASPNSVQDAYGYYQIPELTEQYGINEYFDNTAKAAYYYSTSSGVFFTIDNEKSAKAKGQYVQQKSLGGLIAWMASLDRYNVVTKGMFDGLYGEGYVFPDNEMKFTATTHSAQIVATSTGYEITVLNNENAVETNIALRDAELFQKSIVHMKIYIKTKSGVEFGPGEMCGDVTNKDGIGIVDPSSFYDAKNIAPGDSYTFSVTVPGTPDISDIVSITMTQRILPTLDEFKEQIIYQN
jgi:chitinase